MTLILEGFFTMKMRTYTYFNDCRLGIFLAQQRKEGLDLYTMNKQFRILIVEDNEMFNQLLTSHLKWYAGEIALHNDCTLIIDSFASAEDCLRNLKENTDMAFLDYYLEHGKTAIDILPPLKEKNSDCKVVIISQIHDAKTDVTALNTPSVDFLYKDNHVFSKICFQTEKLLEDKLHSIN